MQSLIITAGSPHAPDDPFGRETLVLHPDGAFHYRRERGTVVERSGQADPQHLAALVRGLQDGGFPTTPPQRMPPGAALASLQLGEGTDPVWVHLHTARKWDGYGPVIRSFESWCAWLRQPAPTEPPPAGLVTVRD